MLEYKNILFKVTKMQIGTYVTDNLSQNIYFLETWVYKEFIRQSSIVCALCIPR